MTDSNRVIFTGMKILRGNEWLKHHAVIVSNGRVEDVVTANMLKRETSATIHEYPEDFYLIPGLIDIHIHGTAGYDVMDGSKQALTEISLALAREGVTGFLATTMTASRQRIESVLKNIANTISENQGAAILGIHLEGPFISSEKKGAQAENEICKPDPELFEHWQGIAKGNIKLVTLAPELPHVSTLIKKLNAMGVITSIGHTNASYAETNDAIAAGCSHATHLFNAMRGIHQRDPGTVGALLLSENINTELIADGLHLHPAILEMTLRLKGKDKLILVTDAMRAKCLGDGQYDLGGQMVSVKSGMAKLADGTLAGSTLSMPHAIKNMAAFTHCSLADAICMASINPARVLGVDKHKGSIEKGKDADLVVMNADFEVETTMINGYECNVSECGL